MASIKIHRDLFNFERLRKGFTQRQIISMIVAVAIAACIAAVVGYLLELPWLVAITLATIVAFPIVAAGFLPLFGMPAEEYARRFWEMHKRGSVLVWDGEEIEQNEKGGVSCAHKKASKKRGYECSE